MPGEKRGPRGGRSAGTWVAAGLGALFLILLIGCLLAPSVVWEQFVWRYLWGPTEADAVGHPVGGVTEDYNLISTFFYGAVLACAVYLIYCLLKRHGVRIGPRYILALVPWVLFGTLGRALEDAFYFSKPAVYLFIAPQVYILVGLLVLGASLAAGRLGARLTALLLWGMVPLYLLLFVFGSAGGAGSEPALLSGAVLAAITTVLSLKVLRERSPVADAPSFLALFGLQSVAAPAFLTAYWCARPPGWGSWPAGASLRPAELLIVPALAVLATLLTWLVLKLLSSRRRALSPLASGTSATILLGHFLDASATFRALDFHSYGEKHVLPGFLIESTGTGLVMFPLKAVAMVTILYILEVELQKDLKGLPLLRGLLRAALLILGLSPGLRDLFRLVMGV